MSWGGGSTFKQQLPIEFELVNAIQSCRVMRTQAAAGTVPWDAYFEAVYALYDELPPTLRKTVDGSTAMAELIELIPRSERERLSKMPRYQRSLVLEKTAHLWRKRAVDQFFRFVNDTLYGAGLLLKERNNRVGLEGEPEAEPEQLGQIDVDVEPNQE